MAEIFDVVLRPAPKLPYSTWYPSYARRWKPVFFADLSDPWPSNRMRTYGPYTAPLRSMSRCLLRDGLPRDTVLRVSATGVSITICEARELSKLDPLATGGYFGVPDKIGPPWPY
jgi:hypothetical protein